MKAIDVDEFKKKVITKLKHIRSNPMLDAEEIYIISAFDTILNMIDNTPTIEIPTWIPVTERLPEEGTYCLWQAEGGHMKTDVLINGKWYEAEKLAMK